MSSASDAASRVPPAGCTAVLGVGVAEDPSAGCSYPGQRWPFKAAAVFARSLKLENMQEWREWSKSGARPANMPPNPSIVYKHEGWQGYGHWLGTGKLPGGKLVFLPFKKALLYARSLNLKSSKEWLS